MRLWVQAILVIVGVIHLLPLSGVVGVKQLEKLYGVTLTDPNLVILMRHRAVLFGLLGVFSIVGALRSELQWAALLSGMVSVLSFLVLAWLSGGYNSQLNKVFWVDVFALVCLGLGAGLLFLREKVSG